jgi:hypothetical protein
MASALGKTWDRERGGRRRRGATDLDSFRARPDGLDGAAIEGPQDWSLVHARWPAGTPMVNRLWGIAMAHAAARRAFAEDSAWSRCHSGRLWIQTSRIVRSSCAWQHQTGSVRAPIGRTISAVVRPHTTHGWPPTPVEPRFRSAVDRHDAARSASCTSRRLSRASSMQRSASQRRSASSCPVNSKLNGPQAGRREDQTVSDFVTPARSIDGQPRWNAALSVTTWSWAL